MKTRRKSPQSEQIDPGFPRFSETDIDRRGMLILLGSGAASVLLNGCGGSERKRGSIVTAKPEKVDGPPRKPSSQKPVQTEMNLKHWMAKSENYSFRMGPLVKGMPGLRPGKASSYDVWTQMPFGRERTSSIGDGRETIYTIKFVHQKTDPKVHFYEFEEEILSIADDAILAHLKSEEDFTRNNLDAMAEEIRRRVLALLPNDGTDWEGDIGLMLISSDTPYSPPDDAGPLGEN